MDASYPQTGLVRKQDTHVGLCSGSTFDIESGAYLNINSGGTLTQAGTLTNSGTLTQSGTLNNTGTINNNGTLASSGTFTLESGGTNTINAGVTLTNKGTIVNSSAGKFRERVVVASTAQALLTYGISVIGTTGTGARAYTLGAPAATGLRKTIWCVNSTGACTVTVSTGATVNYTTTRKFTWIAAGDKQGVDLISTTTANWSIMHRSTTITCT